MSILSRLFSRRPDVEALKKSRALEQLTELLNYQGPHSDIAEDFEIRVAAAKALVELAGFEARGPIERAYEKTIDIERHTREALGIIAHWPQSAKDKTQRALTALEMAKKEFGRLLNLNAELYRAVDNGNRDIAKQLIDSGADVNSWGQYGTPLHRAIYHGNYEIVELLLEKGADVGIATMMGNYPLHMAVANGYAKIAELLLAHGADINARGQGGLTAFELGMRNGKEKLVEMLRTKFGKEGGDSRNAYLIVLYSTEPLHEAEQEDLLRGIKQQLGCPTVFLKSIKVSGPFPTGPDEFVIASALLACEEAGIKFENSRDTISFRGGKFRPGESIGLITVIINGQ